MEASSDVERSDDLEEMDKMEGMNGMDVAAARIGQLRDGLACHCGEMLGVRSQLVAIMLLESLQVEHH